jgi:arabinofuranan 3-O-arabinosyltransferase
MKNTISLFVICVFLIISLQFIISNAKSLHTISQDFEVFYLSGQQVVKGDNPYLLIGKDIVRNPPPTILTYGLLSFLPIKTSQIIWFILSVFSFIAGSYYLFKTFDNYEVKTSLYGRNWKIWLIYLSLVLIFFPFRYNLGSGQVNNFLFLFLVLVFYFLQLKKELWAGFLLSLSILLKITPIFLLFTFLIQKKFKAIKLTVLCTITVLIMSFLLLGGKIYQNYLKVTKSFFDFNISTYYNQSLSGFLARAFNNSELTKWLLYISIVIALISIQLLYKKTKRNNFLSNIIFWNISIIYILILASFAWQYHFVIIIFPLVTTAYIGYKIKFSYKFFFFWFLSYLLIGLNIKNPEAFINKGILGSIILSHVFFGAVILLLLNYSLIWIPASAGMTKRK